MPLPQAPYRPIPYLAPAVDVERRADGSMILRSPLPPPIPTVKTISEFLPHWAATRPDVLMFCQRTPAGDWRSITYAQAWARVQRLALALLDLPLSEDAPLALLSGNSIEYALMLYAADYAGVPVATVSPAYSVMSKDFARLKGIIELVTPGAVFVQATTIYAGALMVLNLPPERTFAVLGATGAQRDVTRLSEGALNAAESARLAAAHDAISPSQVARIYFTSGSTGVPKGVPLTHANFTHTERMGLALYTGDLSQPRTYLDWLPWHHAFGGVANIHRTLANGDTVYIDDGKPLPGMFAATLKNLRDVLGRAKITTLANVPAGFAMLVAELERDPALAQSFLANLETLGYGGAALSSDTWQRFEALAIANGGQKIAFLSGYGATETTAAGTYYYWADDDVGNIGIPIPGSEIKLVPADGAGKADAQGMRYEVRTRGPHVFSGYWKRPDLTKAAFDEEGFYRLGDAVRLADPAQPVKGLRFAGRLVEDFKLASGTWVRVGAARLQAIDLFAPLVRDAVICGHDRDELGVLAWPNEVACRALDASLSDLPLAELVVHPIVTAALQAKLTHQSPEGASHQIARVALMAEPPSIDANEIADKGYVNQAAVLLRRAGLVAALYA